MGQPQARQSANLATSGCMLVLIDRLRQANRFPEDWAKKPLTRSLICNSFVFNNTSI